eukprot:TRINITY_DN2522_c1_g2_i1.p1 TRINITY_DN2522_c1_g2~~TRINITY_DN2522_c1_g2_i1.p1  ORF type:complete len:1913 (+),score=499.43 TRINITY_DN2522_c1_g2_i1:354-5741(+)
MYFGSISVIDPREAIPSTVAIPGGLNVNWECGSADSICYASSNETMLCNLDEEPIFFEKSGSLDVVCSLDGFLGRIGNSEISVPNATKAETSPQIMISGVSDNVIATMKCSESSSVPYCNINSAPMFSDDFICPLEGIDVTPMKHGADKGGSITVFGICAVVGKSTDFDDLEYFTTTIVYDVLIPEFRTEDIVGGVEVWFECDIGTSFCGIDESSMVPCDQANLFELTSSSNRMAFCKLDDVKSSTETYSIIFDIVEEVDVLPTNVVTKDILGGIEVLEITCLSSSSIPLIKIDSPPQRTDYFKDSIDTKLIIDDPSENGLSSIHTGCLPLGMTLTDTNKWSQILTPLKAPDPMFDIHILPVGFTVKVICNLENNPRAYMSDLKSFELNVETDVTGKTITFEDSNVENSKAVCIGDGFTVSDLKLLTIEGNRPSELTVENIWLFPDQPAGDFVTQSHCTDDQLGVKLNVDSEYIRSEPHPTNDGSFVLSLTDSIPEDVNTFEVSLHCVDVVNMFLTKDFTFRVHRPPIINFNEDQLDIQMDEQTLKRTTVSTLPLFDVELDAIITCEILNFSGGGNPFIVEVTNAQNVVENTKASLELIMLHPLLVNAVTKPYFNFDIHCFDEFDLYSEVVPVNVTVLDTVAPSIKLISRPPVATVSSTASFSFEIYDGDEPCPACTFSCLLDNISMQNCRLELVASDISYGEHTFSVIASDSYQSRTETVTWSRVDVAVIPMIKDDPTDENSSVREFIPGVDPFIVSEFGHREDMRIAFANDHIPYKQIGLKLSKPVNSNEIAMIKCSANGDIVTIEPSTLTFRGNELIKWMKISAIEDGSNTSERVSFEIKCDVSSNDPLHYDMSPDLTFIGEKQNVIWPIFDDILLHQLISVDANVTKTVPSVVDGKFSMTTAGEEIITILPHQEFLDNDEGVFLEGMALYLDEIPLERICYKPEEIVNNQCIVWFSDRNVTVDVDPKGIMVQLPSYDDVCVNSVCDKNPYRTLTLKNEFDISSVNKESPYAESIGGALSCPGYCANANEGKGIYFNMECEGYHNGPECRDSSFSQQNCAVRVGSLCSDCPNGAICPGGSRTWPSIGFFTMSESALPQECEIPKEERCLGWDEAAAEPMCGDIYTGPMCQNCIQGYYPGFNDQSCLECPEATLWTYLGPLLIVSALGGGVFLFMFALVWYASRTRGGSMAGGAKRTVSFVIWTVMALQTIIQTGRSAKDHLPESLQTFYSTLNIFQFELDLIHPNCMGSDPLIADKIIMFITIVLHLTIMLIGSILWKTMARLHKVMNGSVSSDSNNRLCLLAKVEKTLFLLSGLFYPIICNTCVKLMDCVDIEGVSYMRSNTILVCYEGETLFLNILAWTLLVVVLFGMPVYTFFRLRSEIIGMKSHLTASRRNVDTNKTLDKALNPESFKLTSCWAYFISNDFKATKYYFRHFNQFTLLIITLAMSFGINAYFTAIVDVAIFTIGIVWYISNQPFISIDKWKTPVKASILMLSIFAAAFNFASAHGGIGVDTMTNLAYGILFTSLLVLIALIGSFTYVLFSGAKLEAVVNAREEKKKSKQLRRASKLLGNKKNKNAKKEQNSMYSDSRNENMVNPLFAHANAHRTFALPEPINDKKNPLSSKGPDHHSERKLAQTVNNNNNNNNKRVVMKGKSHKQQHQQKRTAMRSVAEAKSTAQRFRRMRVNSQRTIPFNDSIEAVSVGPTLMLPSSSALVYGQGSRVNQGNNDNNSSFTNVLPSEIQQAQPTLETNEITKPKRSARKKQRPMVDMHRSITFSTRNLGGYFGFKVEER